MIKVAVMGLGNLGKAAAWAAWEATDIALTALYSRRHFPVDERTDFPPDIPILPLPEPDMLHDPAVFADTDVLLLCGRSREDLPRWTPAFARVCSVVDAFDLHGKAKIHATQTDIAAKEGKNAAIVCAGWDPGLFSLLRLYGSAFFGDPAPRTFWGPGVSEGHSTALRTLPGVTAAAAYTIPAPTLPGGHRRICYIVKEPDADEAMIKAGVFSLHDYFGDCPIELHFISEARFEAEHHLLPHGGRVLMQAADGASGDFILRLPSNPGFTASVMLACARAAYRLKEAGKLGCFTMPELPPVLFSPLPPKDAAFAWL